MTDQRSTIETYHAQAQTLLDLKRYADAGRVLCEWLAHAPDDARAHALLGYTLYLQDRNTEALRDAESAIGAEPNLPDGYHVQSLALLELGRAGSALKAIQEALRLDPENASYYAGLARIYVRQKNWKRALNAAEEGLKWDPEHTLCANLRGMALVNLGQRDEADHTLKKALARNPESALTQANQGWALLHRGDHQQAVVHFKEALRLDPMSDWARQGVLEALKARNLLYRWLLRYFLWMSRLTRAEQGETVAVVAGAWHALRVIARQAPLLYVIVLPLSLIWFLFAVFTWVSRPLFALALRFDPLGRLALPEEEVKASNWAAACLITALVGVILGIGLLVAYGNAGFFVLAAAALAMLVPVAGVFRADPGWGRVTLAVYSVLMALCGLGASIFALIGSWGWVLAGIFGVIFGLGWIVYSWTASLVIILSAKT
ncbi:MAG: tetratricopeptide repeat protein [Anaerolineae bacterium]|nr:tetratricopeptide repeat protein [Anaerolineae bacterium]